MSLRDRFEADGVVVIRDCVPIDMARRWIDSWVDYARTIKRTVEQRNPVELKMGFDTPLDLLAICQCPQILDAVEGVLGPDIALYNRRFVVKDKDSRGPVPIHQDSGYHRGFFNKLSAFVPLSNVTVANGGIAFAIGSHKYGYLGDAGHIDPAFLDDFITVSPTLFPGDIVLMHSSTWHWSGPWLNGDDRVLVDIHYQPANDPSSIALLRGEWRTPLRYTEKMRNSPFISSRVMRLKELEQR